MKRIVTSALFALGLAAWAASGALAKSDRAEAATTDAQTETLSTIPGTGGEREPLAEAGRL